MRTNIDLNEQLINEAMLLNDAKTKKEVVDLALQYYIGSLKRQKMKSLFGKVTWEGNLKKMREI